MWGNIIPLKIPFFQKALRKGKYHNIKTKPSSKKPCKGDIIITIKHATIHKALKGRHYYSHEGAIVFQP
jgi:hypothetical protein